jgi:L-asparaginase II
MTQTNYTSIYELTRGRIVESVHFGAIAVVTNKNELVASHGDPDTITFLRSSAKPFQALPMVESGGVDKYGFTLREVALICASHSGTDEHVETARSIQSKAGVLESDLMCGVHSLSHRPTVEAMNQRGEKLSPNRHNCSGKHSGMVAYARMRGLPYGGDRAYIDPNHPIQQTILKTFAEMCSLTEDQVEIGIDGCSAPNFAVPLRNAALAFARLCDPVDLSENRRQACRTIFQAMTTNPEMVGGPDSFDTILMQTTRGKVLCKGGAEGYQALGLRPGALGPDSPAMGICFKISDGDLASHTRGTGAASGHIRPAVTVEILRQLGALTDDELAGLVEYGPTFPIHNWRKLLVGEGRPCFKFTLG